uniref:Uncharacterized protein n=1 Tax=Oryza punctata TaxID=4537 RepID=A0A0E0K6R9_ORYPU
MHDYVELHICSFIPDRVTIPTNGSHPTDNCFKGVALLSFQTTASPNKGSGALALKDQPLLVFAMRA